MQQSLFFYICRMKLKWLIGSVALFLAILGVLPQEHTIQANQTVVFQFHDTNAAPTHTQAALHVIEDELNDFGILDVKITKSANGKIKVSYYSTTDPETIKQVIAERISAELVYDESNNKSQPKYPPFKKAYFGYNLDVLDIGDRNHGHSGLNGVQVVELDHKASRFFKPNGYSTLSIPSLGSTTAPVVLNGYPKTSFTQNRLLYHIQEVRAGPIG